MHYVLDENNNKIEGLSKEDTIALLNQAIADGTLDNIVAAAGISKVKCCVSGSIYKLAFVTQAKYNELEAAGTLVENCYYFIIDDSTAGGINKVLETLTTTLNEKATALDKLTTRVETLESKWVTGKYGLFAIEFALTSAPKDKYVAMLNVYPVGASNHKAVAAVVTEDLVCFTLPYGSNVTADNITISILNADAAITSDEVTISNIFEIKKYNM